MVQLAKPHWVRITDLMLDLWDPSKDPQKTTLWANESLSEPQKVPKFHIEGPKCILLVATIHLEHYLTIGTKSGDSGPFESNLSWSFQRPKGQILDYLRLKRAWFAQKNGLLKAPKGVQISQIGSVMHTQWSLASWTILWNLEPLLVDRSCRRLPERQKSPHQGRLNPLGAPQTPQKFLWTPQIPPIYFSDPPCNQYNPFHNLVTHYYSQNTRIATETPKMPPKRQKWPKTPKISEMQKVQILKCDPYSSPLMITDPKICEKPKKTPWNA